MDLSMYPPEIAALMMRQLALGSGGGGSAGPAPVRPQAPAIDPSFYGQPLGLDTPFTPQAPQAPQAPNPLLVGNDALRQQFAAQPDLAPANNPGWIDQREAHLLGNDAVPQLQPPAPAGMPQDFYNAMLEAGAQPHDQSPAQGLPDASAPQLPPAPQITPSAPLRAPDQAKGLPDPFNPAPTTMAEAFQPGSIGQFAQPDPVRSTMSPAPFAPAMANINNNVVMPQSTFTAAPKLPELPKVQPNITPNMGAYSPPPSMPGYGMARTGSPFQAPQSQANLLPTFSMFGGNSPSSPSNPTVAPSLYSQEPGSLYEQMLRSQRSLFA
jgi:hypothetical protein